MTLLPFQLFFYNQTMLANAFQEVQGYLTGPTLVVHDGSGDVDIILKILAPSGPMLVVETDNPLSVDQQKPGLHPTKNQHMPQSTVIIAKGPDPLLHSLRRWSIWSAQSRVVLVLEPGANVRAWLDAMWRKTKAVDVLAMVVTQPPQYYTWFPYQKEECTNVTTITRLNRTNLYPPKIGEHLNSCSFAAVTSHLHLLVVDDFEGVESRLFHDLTQKVGLNRTFVRLPQGLYVWTSTNRDGEPVNGLKLVWENIADMMFSNIGRSYESNPFADFLPSHLTDQTVFFVPGPKPVSRATAIFRTFSLEGWAWVLGSTFAIFATLSLIPMIEMGKYRPAVLDTLAIALSLPTILMSSRKFQWFSMVAYLYSIHITTAYQSSLIVFLSDVPREKPIRTWEELAETDLKIKIHEAYRDVLTAMSKNPSISTLSQPDRASFLPSLPLRTLIVEGGFAILGPKLSFGHIVEEGETSYDNFGYPLVKILKEPVETTRFKFFLLSKGHPLTRKMHNHMLHLIEGGLPQHYHDALKKPPRPLLRQLVAFSTENVEGPFFLYLLMLGTSFIGWLLELVIYKCMKPKALGASKEDLGVLASKSKKTSSDR